MNDVLQAMQSRRSVRCYKPVQVATADLEAILDVGLGAPNAMNLQKWHFTVIQDQALLGRMVAALKAIALKSDNEFIARMAADPNYNTFYAAPSVILISAADQAHWADFDCAAAAENIALAATSLGLASCIIGSSGALFASNEGPACLKELGVPDGYHHVCTIAIGYAEGGVPPTPPRNRDVINYVR